MHDLSEQTLTKGLKNGDRGAMKNLYGLYSGYLNAVCSRYVLDKSTVKDILQDSFVKIFSSIDKFEYRGPGSLKAWITRITVNETLKYLRKSAKDMMTVDFCEAFGLVKYSCLAGGADTPGVTTEAIELSSEVSMSQIGLSPEVEAAIRDSVADYGLMAVELDEVTGELSLIRGEKTQFSAGELNEKGELRITFNY